MKPYIINLGVIVAEWDGKGKPVLHFVNEGEPTETNEN